jgi:hypothetical protein
MHIKHKIANMMLFSEFFAKPNAFSKVVAEFYVQYGIMAFASSIGPTPKKHPDDDDGALIIYNFTNRHEPATLIFPFITDFVEKPTLKHARNLLKRYKIHLPLSTMLPKNKQSHSTRPETKPDANPKVQPKAKGGGKPSLQYELLVLDTMHDLLNNEPETVLKIFKREMDLPKPLKDDFLKSSYSFTRNAANYIEKKANITLNHSGFDLATKKAHDFKLASAISSWTSLTFVLDNFVADLKNGGGGPMSRGMMMLIGCAYMIVLLSNMKHLDLLGSSQSVNFLDGFFMNIDGDYAARFLGLFCKTIKRLTFLDTSVVPYITYSNITTPKHFNRLFPEARASVDGVEIKLGDNVYNFASSGSKSAIVYPHTKREFFQHIKNNPLNKDIWYLNFLRDAFKADVAMETNAVFITHDRLAFTYYKMIGGKHGFLICADSWVDARLMQYCEYEVVF